jgi:hypothetical protein
MSIVFRAYLNDHSATNPFLPIVRIFRTGFHQFHQFGLMHFDSIPSVFTNPFHETIIISSRTRAFYQPQPQFQPLSVSSETFRPDSNNFISCPTFIKHPFIHSITFRHHFAVSSATRGF